MTFYRLPVLRQESLPPARPRATEDLYESLMKRGQRIYAAWNTPMRPWPAPAQRIVDAHLGRLHQERDAKRLRRKRLKLPKLHDKPRIIPFKGHCFKRWLASARAWNAKRQGWREEDYRHRASGKSHPIFG